MWAEVAAVGPTVRTVEAGDTVLFSPDTGFEVEIQGEEYLILRERDVHAVASPRERGRHGALPVIDPATAALRLDGKAVLVTGGTRGIGRAIAEARAAAGAGVCVVARKPAELEETAAAIAALGAPVVTVAGSVGDPDVADAAVAHDDRHARPLRRRRQQRRDQSGRSAPLMDADLGAVTKVFDANITAPLRFARAGVARST